MSPARTFLVVLFLLVLLPAAGTARCLSYGSSVTIVGRLATKTVPGPPNYTSLARGDIPETIVLLRVEEPLCISGEVTSRTEKSHAGIEEVQLVMPAEKARAWVGKKVRAVGVLVGAHTGHHRTPVVLQVSRVSGA